MPTVRYVVLNPGRKRVRVAIVLYGRIEKTHLREHFKIEKSVQTAKSLVMVGKVVSIVISRRFLLKGDVLRKKEMQNSPSKAYLCWASIIAFIFQH
jgi:hypothetical protein